MDKIIELSDKIDNSSNMNDKIKLIKELNEMIEIEKKKLNNILDNDIKNIKTKIPIKYKKMPIDELEDEFEKCNNINEKILIYFAIDKYYSNIEEDLFEIE
jgi:hypothetical protein